MLITLIVYIIILSIIIFRGFCKNIFLREPFSVQKNTESLATFIQIESLPFYFNQGKINLFVFLINFFGLVLLQDSTIFCQGSDTEQKSDNSGMSDSDSEYDYEKWIKEAERLNNQYIKTIDIFGHKKLELIKETCQNKNQDYNQIKLIIEGELALKKKFDYFAEKNLMPSYCLKDCLLRFKMSLETTQFAFRTFFDESGLTKIIPKDDLKKINEYKDINSNILSDLNQFQQNYPWSDIENDN